MFKNACIIIKIHEQPTTENILNITSERTNDSPFRGKEILNNTLADYLCDSGADISIINHELYNEIIENNPQTEIKPYTRSQIRSYNGKIKILGSKRLDRCMFDHECDLRDTEIIVVEEETTNKLIVGRDLINKISKLLNTMSEMRSTVNQMSNNVHKYY